MICFDTMVLIWGVQGWASPGQEELVGRTKRYVTSLARENERIMVPTPALTEYLQHFDDAERKRQLQHFEKLAAGKIQISEVPDIHEQPTLDLTP